MPDIRIRLEDLNDPSIDEVINLEKSLSRSSGEFVEDIKTPFYMNPIFYYALGGLVAALAAWGVFEPLYTDDESTIPYISDYILFGTTAGFIGLAIGLTYGIANRNLRKMLYCGVVGIGVGLGATLLTTLIAEWIFGIALALVGALIQQSGPVPNGEWPIRGMAFFILICGRGCAWAAVSTGTGLGLGVALKSRKLTLNGLAGGLVGGLLGGLFFDPIGRLAGNLSDATISRGVGVAAVGLLVGFFIGFFENISKDAWFLMLKGPLAGKQFSIFKSPMVVGSAPKCDIYLFKDPGIEPRHATITKSGTRYLLTDEGGGGSTLVNGRSIQKYVLQPGDVITVGETVLKYHEREKR